MAWLPTDCCCRCIKLSLTVNVVIPALALSEEVFFAESVHIGLSHMPGEAWSQKAYARITI